MRFLCFVSCMVIATMAGCNVNVQVDDEGVRVKAPGIDIDVSDENGVNVDAPGVDINVKDEDVEVHAPGIDIEVDEENISVDAPGGNVQVNGDENNNG